LLELGQWFSETFGFGLEQVMTEAQTLKISGIQTQMAGAGEGNNVIAMDGAFDVSFGHAFLAVCMRQSGTSAGAIGTRLALAERAALAQESIAQFLIIGTIASLRRCASLACRCGLAFGALIRAFNGIVRASWMVAGTLRLSRDGGVVTLGLAWVLHCGGRPSMIVWHKNN
jgi:hypothetical protein